MSRSEALHKGVQAMNEAVRGLRALILSGENYGQSLARTIGLGEKDTQAICYLALHGERGQNDLASDLGITSSASTALVDRLERRGLAERFAHPSDRRRVLVRLSDKGHEVMTLSHQWLAASLAGVPADELPALSRTLSQIAEDLRERCRALSSRTPDTATASPASGEEPARLRDTRALDHQRRAQSDGQARAQIDGQARAQIDGQARAQIDGQRRAQSDGQVAMDEEAEPLIESGSGGPG
jgi:DNA-binding MarR family transcriptional regulator